MSHYILAPGTQPPVSDPPFRSLVDGERKYELQVIQQPKRARMCGFGDKDRRPITPPPCVRLIITDIRTGKEVDCNEIDHGMFVLNVDLWSEDASKEVNLVRHSASSPPVNSVAPMTYGNLDSGSQSYVAMVSVSQPPAGGMPRSNQGYQNTQFKIEGGPNQGQAGYGTAQSSAPYNPYPSQPPQVTAFSQPHVNQSPYYSEPHQQGYAHAPTTNGGHYQPQNGYQAPQQPSQFYSGAAIHQAGQQQQQLSGPSPVHSMPQPHPSYEQKDPINTRPASMPTGMFTRNLIGSLAASAFRLTDPDDRIGIWFVLQDLSVRTEGQFRLRFSFVNVGLSGNSSGASAGAIANVNANQINTGKVPVLATVFSDVFTVFSAKKFPGVVESTHLSKCFATQGIKIPIRKDGPGGKDKGRDEYDED